MCFVLQLWHFPCVLSFSFGSSHVFCASALALPMCFVLQLWHFPCVLSFSFGSSHVFCASALALPFVLQLWHFPCVLCFSFGTFHVFCASACVLCFTFGSDIDCRAPEQQPGPGKVILFHYLFHLGSAQTRFATPRYLYITSSTTFLTSSDISLVHPLSLSCLSLCVCYSTLIQPQCHPHYPKCIPDCYHHFLKLYSALHKHVQVVHEHEVCDWVGLMVCLEILSQHQDLEVQGYICKIAVEAVIESPWKSSCWTIRNQLSHSHDCFGDTYCFRCVINPLVQGHVVSYAVINPCQRQILHVPQGLLCNQLTISQCIYASLRNHFKGILI